jgi:L-lysine 2,3-aminomutase
MAPLKPNPIKATRFDAKPEAFQVYTERQLDKIDALTLLTEAQRFEMRVVAHVLPFRVNRYVIDNLIDWHNIPDDPIFRLVFPQRVCTFCFRWAQFIGDKNLRFSCKEADRLREYLAKHKSVSDLLITGGDPMVMKTDHLAVYLESLIQPELNHIQTIRIGTKSLSFWPQRYVSDEDSDSLLELLEKIIKAGKHVAIMAHYNHWREMTTPLFRSSTGARLGSLSTGNTTRIRIGENCARTVNEHRAG